MNERLLEKIGLSRGEIKVFLALNRLGDSSIGKIVEESTVSKSKVYDILSKLINKGLVGYAIRDGIKHFFVNSPHTILDYVSQRETQAKKVKDEVLKELPSLESARATFSSKRFAEIYEGNNGIKSVRMELLESLKPGQELLVLGAPRVYNEKYEAWLLQEFHKKRIKNKVSMRIIYNSDVRDYGAKRERMKITKVKYMPNNLATPTWIDIFGDALLLVVMGQKPVAFVLRDAIAAQSFKNYFDLLWGISIE